MENRHQKNAPVGNIEAPVKPEKTFEPDDGATKEIVSKEIKMGSGIRAAVKGTKKSKRKNDKSATKSIVISLVQCILYIAFIGGVSFFLAKTAINVANDVFALKKDTDTTYSITLGEYATVDRIADELEQNGIIKYAGVFKLYSKLRKDNGRFLVGTFELNSGMDYDTIRSILKFETVESKDIRLTIPEGFTVDQIIDLLVENKIGTRERFVEVINGYDFRFDFLPAMETLDPDRKYRLEGYLFPDTYDFAPTESEEEVISKFLRNFKVKFESVYYAKARKLDMSVDDVIIIASMIEKEAKNATDFGLISSVFHNRLNSKAFTRMESDATINYFLEEHADVVTEAMTKIDNPYNTYIREGLPPGPICNPGYEAIAYAFYPEKTGYFYFVSQNDGTTYYASNYAAHQNNIAKARKANAAAAAK